MHIQVIKLSYQNVFIAVQTTIVPAEAKHSTPMEKHLLLKPTYT